MTGSDQLASLRGVRARRADLDAAERAAIDAARAAGHSWASIAEALGLGSRQAAEQRRLRLDDATSGRDPRAARAAIAGRRRRDAALGRPLAALRAAMVDLSAALAADLSADASSGPGTVAGARRGAAVPSLARQTSAVLSLARQTAALAVDAEPGRLVDLARLLVADLGGGPWPAAISRARDRLTEAVAAV